MKSGKNILCFWPGNENVYKHPYFSKFSRKTKRGYGVEVVILVNNVKKVYSQARKFANVVEELKLKPWGLWDFRIEDPFGYYIRISEPYDTLDGKENAVP